MKKRALGSFCLTNYIMCIFFLLLLVIAFICCIFVNIGMFFFFLFIMLPVSLFAFAQILLLLSKCWYVIGDSFVTISVLIGKKKNRLDFLTVPEGAKTWIGCKNSYQPEVYELSFNNIKEICCLSEYKINKSGLKRNDIVILLNDNKKAYLSRRQFSKVQVLEIINTMIEKNKDIELGERLRRELKLT